MCKLKHHSLFSWRRNIFLLLFLISTVIQVTSVSAVTIDVIKFDPSIFQASISDINEGDQNNVYTIDAENGILTFGDGEQGDRLPATSGGIIASYSRGGGASGNVPDGIFEIYIMPTDFSPFLLPGSFFSVNHDGNTDFSFVLSGLSSLDLEITDNRMWITDVVPVPEPATVSLMVFGLAGLAAFVRIRGIKR